MVKSGETDLQPLSGNMETLVEQIVSRVKSNYYEGLPLDKCPDFDRPLRPIVSANVSKKIRLYNRYICAAYEKDEQFKKDVKGSINKSYQQLKDAGHKLHKESADYDAKKSTVVAGGVRKRKHEKEVEDDDKINIWQHRQTIAKIIAMPIGDVRIELTKHLDLLKDKIGEAPTITRPPNELRADLVAVQLFQLNQECLFNPAECVDAILGEDKDIPEEEGETGNDQQSE